VKKKLDAYKGRLSPNQVASGMNAAISNAARLANDAETLLEAGRFPTAASIVILSIEESGKVSALRAIALAKTDTESEQTWRDYRSHT
jgi:AbiV family abortive infection protein